MSRRGAAWLPRQATHETRYNMMACAVDNLIDALQGKIERKNPRQLAGGGII